MPERTFLRTTELAERWAVSTGHLANLRVQGRGPSYVKLGGGSVRYSLADVEAFEMLGRVEAVA